MSAAVALGVSLGFNFARANRGHGGPDLLELIRGSPGEIPEDVQEECLAGIAKDERPQKGDWFVIWGGIPNHTFPNIEQLWLTVQHQQTLAWLPYSLRS